MVCGRMKILLRTRSIRFTNRYYEACDVHTQIFFHISSCFSLDFPISQLNWHECSVSSGCLEVCYRSNENLHWHLVGHVNPSLFDSNKFVVEQNLQKGTDR